jgi:hypothetical protein
MEIAVKADVSPGARPILSAFGRYEHFLHESCRRAIIAPSRTSLGNDNHNHLLDSRASAQKQGRLRLRGFWRTKDVIHMRGI